MIDLQRALRAIAVLATALALSQCGDGSGNDNGVDEGSPTPGTFVGTLGVGGSITLQVGSIEAVGFDCDGVTIHESFSPPRSVDADGNFAVEFSDAGRAFAVRGTFRDDDHVTGTIDDKRDRCDTTFAATRSTLPPTPTPVITPTATGPVTTTETPTEPPPTATATGSPGTPTATLTGVTPTEPTRTPSPTATPSIKPTGPQCPVAVEVIGTAGAAKVLDTGFTGIAHEQTVIQDGKITMALSGCDAACKQCTLGGPIQNVNADHGDINAHRCVSDTSVECTGDTDCSSGKCAFFFGAPLPLSAGGAVTCITNQVNGNATGTANVETGAFASTLNLTSRVFLGIANDLPCPVCVGDSTVNDGTKGGTCNGGSGYARNGQPCDGNGRSPIPSFGTTSFDCPPNAGAFIASLSIPLDGSSGTETMSLTASSPKCISQPSKKCFCPGDLQAPNQPNSCFDDTATPAVEGCAPKSGSQTKGACPVGPVDTNCKIESFRGCLTNADCPAAGDSCAAQNRPCYLDNGEVGGSVTAIGMADAPDANGESDPVFAALFCVGKTGRAAIDSVAGLPGLGRIELPLHSKQIRSLP